MKKALVSILSATLLLGSAQAAFAAPQDQFEKKLAPKAIIGENWKSPAGVVGEERVWNYLESKKESLKIGKKTELRKQLKVVKEVYWMRKQELSITV